MNIFDVETTYEDAAIVMIPVPWEATTSYGQGTALGPELILNASAQQDLHDYYFKDNYKAGYFMLEIPQDLLDLSFATRKLCEKARDGDKAALLAANQNCEIMNQYVYANAKKILDDGKTPAVVGGDHSTPFGLIKAIGDKDSGIYGILHIDAHADLREAYQGFTHSHASIFYNVMTASFQPQKLVQVGIRDYCAEEEDFIRQHESKIHTFFDPAIKEKANWRESCEEIVSLLPKDVYISVDIDGFDPKLCPNTGTPVPGGLDFSNFQQLLHILVGSGKRIIGFDVNEVSTGPSYDLSNEWDGNVGMRVLFQLCGWCVESQKQKFT